MKTPTRAALEASNKAFVLPSVPHIAEHIAAMRAKAQTSKFECARVVDWRTGCTLWESSGECESSISMDGAMHCTRGNLMIHTHPISAELSLPDLVCCASMQARANLAVCGDETLSWSTGLNARAAHMSVFQWHWMQDCARMEYGFQPDKLNLQHPRECAVDNYWLAHGVVGAGLVNEYRTFYSPALINLIAGE